MHTAFFFFNDTATTEIYPPSLPAALPIFAGPSAALATLRKLARACKLPVSFDLAELRGYHYHSGVVLDAYCDGVTGAVARGGRYDEVGKAFGRARPATGFSIYLRSLAGPGR